MFKKFINTYSKYIEIPGVAIITSCIKDRNYELKDLLEKMKSIVL